LQKGEKQVTHTGYPDVVVRSYLNYLEKSYVSNIQLFAFLRLCGFMSIPGNPWQCIGQSYFSVKFDIV
jgi:hypothetical protein